MSAALQRARLLGYGYVVVLGHAEYYSRFGFVPASRFALRYEADVSEEHFMALELVPGALDDVSGVRIRNSTWEIPRWDRRLAFGGAERKALQNRR